MSNEKSHNRPKYSVEFKQDATTLVLEKGYSQQQAADHLGISQSALGRWVRAERKPSVNESATKSSLNLTAHDELIRLRKENEQLRMEREILKKGRGLLCERNRIKYGFTPNDLKLPRTVTTMSPYHPIGWTANSKWLSLRSCLAKH